ncbi:hypothetical protein D3P07_22100 [Paenibacillus sp. 1011MAR3C5]|uniref:DUF6843 domain-containing protein n=1 Tax=Paenibacillus sp. 1011MAR3C5 TaxID=1675787 RepID=UPI000E6C2C91|nr:hypothetical protein [Paenibacillus sp. 1011MAR3C5]RJE84628.1 hypothetical protein D3P07_22100 [Paenibacillus sp. 1011MAR3C5]
MVKKSRAFNMVMWVSTLIIVCMAAGVIILLSISENKITHKYILPEGFTGWVEIIYEQPGYPALKKEGKKYIYNVPESGKMLTSTKNFSGPMDFSYMDRNGKLIEFRTVSPMIHGVNTSSGGSSSGEIFPQKVTFFVGTEEQWREASEIRQK